MFAKTKVLLGIAGAMLLPQIAHAQRPSQWAACRAWNIHIADLIDQHRIINDLDEAKLYDVVWLFYDAEPSCAQERFDEGLLLYETIPIGQAAHPELR
jgi:hypothetical protein